jgi:hypothetical protein
METLMDITNKTTFIPTVSNEILAKLLATENLHIVHDAKAQVACCDLKSRTLYLPVWKDITKEIYITFCSHEVGHALFTSVELPADIRLNHMAFNIIEDARVNKLIQRKFPGLGREFSVGCKQLVARDFYGTRDRDLSEFGLLDRINLYYKFDIMNRPMVPFLPKERLILEKIDRCETQDEVYDIVRSLVDHIKQSEHAPELEMEAQEGESNSDGENENPNSTPSKSDSDSDDSDKGENSDVDSTEKNKEESSSAEENNENNENGENGENSDVDSTEKNKEESSSAEENNENNENNENGENSPLKTGSLFSSTQLNEEKNKANLIDTFAERQITPKYVKIPNKVNLDDYVIPYKEVHEVFAKFIDKHAQILGAPYEVCFNALSRFKSDNDKIINYLVKEFEMKKAADVHKRTSFSKTGHLNMDRIHSYRYNDDLFLKSIKIAEGKNHGLVMFMDCSGSMESIMLDVIDQILNLVFFCKKVNIPFEVYGFRTTGRNVDHALRKERETSQVNQFLLGTVSLRNYLSYKMTANEFRKAVIHMIFLKLYIKTNSIPDEEKLSYTPLNSTIVIAKDVVKKFREETNSQIVNTVFLTDGENCPPSVCRDKAYSNYALSECRLRNQDVLELNCRQYRNLDSQTLNVHDRYSNYVTINLFNAFRDDTGSKVIGFYILPRDIRYNNKIIRRRLRNGIPSCICQFFDTETESILDEIMKNNGNLVKNNFIGYDTLCMYESQPLDSNSFGKSLEKELNAKQRKSDCKKVGNLSFLKKRMIKAVGVVQKNKIQSRMLLSGFIDSISK